VWGVGLLIVGTVGAAGCSSGTASAGSGRLSVVANFYPIAEAAAVVGGNRVSVTNLTPTGAEPHDLELSPHQVDQIQDARVLFYMGRGFQPAVEEAALRRTSGLTIDLLQSVAMDLRGLSSSESLEGGLDPHVWLDPVLMGVLVDRIEGALAQADPAGRAVYERNAATYRASLDALDQRYRTGLATCDRSVIVTSHAAFGYLAARYGLQQLAISGLSPEAEPDPKRLAELSDLVHKEGVTTIFTETLVSARVADALAREAGVQTAVLDPLEGLTAGEQAKGETYITIMDRNLAILRAALGCS
jgi:zinc transport system substrate-binding protein